MKNKLREFFNNDNNEEIFVLSGLCVCLSIIIVIVFYYMFFEPYIVKAAGEEINQTEQLPFRYEYIDYCNSFLTEDFFTAMQNQNLPIDDSDYVLIFKEQSFYGRHDSIYYTFRFYFDLMPIESFNAVSNYGSVDLSTAALPFSLISGKDYYSIVISADYTTSSGDPYAITGCTYTTNFSTPNLTMFGHSTSVDTVILTNDYKYNFTSRSPVLFLKSFKDVNNQVILLLGNVSPEIPEDDIIPSDSDKPVFDNYVPDWENSPTIDTTSAESLLESIFNLNKWVGENLKDTITGTGKYIVDSTYYTGQKIIGNIRNAINDVKDTITDFKDSVVETFEYITEPISVSDLIDTVEGTNLYGTVNTVTTSVTGFTGNFNNLAAPETFKIPIHLENLPEEYFGIQTTQYFDLGWFSQFFPALRTFTWCFVTFGLFYTVISSFISMVKGG